MSVLPTTPHADALAAYIARGRERVYAPAVIDAAKQALVDWCGVAIGGWREPAARRARYTAELWRAAGRSRIVLGGTTTAPLAALVNGTMAHCMDFDDTRANGAAHLGGPTWAAALALAGELRAEGAAVLAAFVTGYEVAVQLGGDGLQTVFERHVLADGFHPTAVFGRLSAAAAGAVLYGLDSTQATHALGVAATCAGGLNGSFGTMAKPFHAGKAALDGILAAQLAQEGFQAATHLLEAEGPLARALVQDGAAPITLTLTPGETLLLNTYKPYACGQLVHGHIDAAVRLRAQTPPETITAIEARVAPLQAQLVGIPRPATGLETKFSVPYAIALGLLGYPALEHDFSAERLAEPGLQRLLGLVTQVPDPTVQPYGGRLIAQLADGRTLAENVPEARGKPGNPLTWSDLEAKFTSLVEPVLGPAAPPLLHGLRHCEEPGRLAEVLALLGPPPDSAP